MPDNRTEIQKKKKSTFVSACMGLIKQCIGEINGKNDKPAQQNGLQRAASLLHFLARINVLPAMKNDIEQFITETRQTLIELDKHHSLPPDFNPLDNPQKGDALTVCFSIVDDFFKKFLVGEIAVFNAFYSLEPLVIWLSSIKLDAADRNRAGFYVVMTIYTLEHYDKDSDPDDIRKNFYARRDEFRRAVLDQ